MSPYFFLALWWQGQGNKYYLALKRHKYRLIYVLCAIHQMDEKNLNKASKEFWETFEKITYILQKARGVEVLLKIVVELSEHANIQKKQDYKKYLASNFKFEISKYDKLINRFFPDNKNEFHAIRLIADNIAHGNFHGAHLKVDDYLKTYSVKSKIDKTKKAGLFLLDNVQIDNEKYKIGYLVEPDVDNLILEEFRAFEIQGYYQVCEEIFNRANEIINPQRKDIGRLNFAVMIMRGLKRGVREKST